MEIMGRNAGWLTAASSLSRVNGNRGPDFIYLCEVPFSISRFLDDIRSRQSENRNLLIAVSEGIRDENGNYLSEQTPGNRPTGSAIRILQEPEASWPRLSEMSWDARHAPWSSISCSAAPPIWPAAQI